MVISLYTNPQDLYIGHPIIGISYALDTTDHEEAFENLCTIGNNHYQSRIDGVKAHIRSLEEADIFNKKYKADTNEFV